MSSSAAGVRGTEVRDDEGTRGLEVRFDVDAPRDAVLDLLWDPAHFPELYPEIESVAILERDDRRMRAEYRVNAVVKRVRYELERTLDRESGTLRWRELGGDLRKVRGEWRVDARGSGSTLTYRAFVDVGYFVPTALVRDLAMAKLGEMVARVQRVAGRLTAR